MPKAWPFEEAAKVVGRLDKLGKTEALFETGYGPSGLPHIGTFNEVARTSFVRHAYHELTGGAPTRLIAFSDDMDGLRKVPDLDRTTVRDTAETIGDPVAVKEDTLARAGSYGAGLAPFFMSLAAWIGAYVLFLLVRPLSSRALAANGPATRTALGGWVPPAVVGLVQVAVMFTIVRFALDIDPVYEVATAAVLVNHYAKRWTIEPAFRDTKDLRFGMGLSSTRIGEPMRRDRLLLVSAFATALLTLMGAVGESLGMDRLLKSNTSKTRSHSLFRQGCMLYELIPNMPEHRLAPAGCARGSGRPRTGRG